MLERKEVARWQKGEHSFILQEKIFSDGKVLQHFA